MVKDTSLIYGPIFVVAIIKDLLESVKLAKQLYNHDLEKKKRKKKKIAEAEKLQVPAKKDEEKVQQELQQLHSKVRQVSDGLAVADDLVKECNDELKNCLL